MLTEVFGEVFSGRFWRNYSALLPAGLAMVAVNVAFSLVYFLLVLGPFFQSLPAPGGRSFSIGPFLWSFVGGILLSVIAVLLVTTYLSILLIRACRQVRQGKASFGETFWETLPGSLRPWLSYLGAWGLMFAIGMGAGGLVALLVLWGGPAGALVAIPTVIAGICFLVYAMVKLLFLPVAIVVDGERAVAALRKSWRLTRGKWWPVFGTFLLLGIVLGVIALVISMAITLPLSASAGSSPLTTFQPTIPGLSPSLLWAMALSMAVQSAVLILLLTLPLTYGLVVAWEVLKGEFPPAVTPSAENRSA